MVQSTSDLSREEIRRALVGSSARTRCTWTRSCSRPRASIGSRSTWRSTASYDGPIPAAVVAVTSTEEVCQGALVRERAPDQRRAPHRGHLDRRWARDDRGGHDRARRLIHERDRPHRHREHDGHRTVRRRASRCWKTPSACRASRRATRLSPSPSPRWAALPRPARSGSCRRSTEGSRTWSSGSRPCSRTARICRIKNVPRRAVGPDIRHIVIGNEGALCFITEVTRQAVSSTAGEQRGPGLPRRRHGRRESPSSVRS